MRRLQYKTKQQFNNYTQQHQTGRIRSFKHHLIERANLFEGLPYIQFDAFVRRDRTMQHVVIRDLLKIITEKSNQLKNLLLDKARMKKVFQLMDLMGQARRKAQFNQRLEETIALIDSIGTIILQDYSKNPESIGLTHSPVYQYQLNEDNNVLEKVEIHQEEKIYEQNVDIFIKMLTFLRDRVDVYMIMIRQASQKIIDDATCMDLLKDVTALRYNLMQLQEDIRIYDSNSDEHLRLLKLTSKSKDALDKINSLELQKGKTISLIQEDTPEQEMQVFEAQTQKKRAQRLNELLAKKFNFSKNNLQLKESRLVLNQDKLEQEKMLLLESSMKASKIKHIPADNRKRLAIEKLQDPTKDPNMREALEIMARVLNINIADQFQ